jgi:hypothetical protein
MTLKGFLLSLEISVSSPAPTISVIGSAVFIAPK